MPFLPARKLAKPPLPDFLDIDQNGSNVRVRIRTREDAKRMILRVSSVTAEVILTMPGRGDINAAKRFIDANSSWIAQRIQRIPEIVAFKPNAVIPFKGVPHRIVHKGDLRGCAVTLDEQNSERVIVVTGDLPHLSRRVREFLQAQARKDVSTAVRYYTEKLGMSARGITIRDTRSRWGSCSSKGHLNFSWRLIMAPPLVLDYLAAHEVAHLCEMNHSSRFWTLTRQLCPSTDQAEAWLKRHGASLHRYG